MVDKLRRIWGFIGPVFFIALGVYILQSTETTLGRIIGWACIISWSLLISYVVFKYLKRPKK